MHWQRENRGCSRCVGEKDREHCKKLMEGRKSDKLSEHDRLGPET